MIIFEASPVAYGYETPLADTGITRVIKNLLIHIDQKLEHKKLKIFLYAQENLWNQFLLNKFIYENSLKTISPIVCGRLLIYHCASYYSAPVDELMAIKPQLTERSMAVTVLTDLAKDKQVLFHSNYLAVPDFIRQMNKLSVLHTVHDIFPLSHKGLFSEGVASFYRNYLSTFRGGDKVACVSKYTAEQFKKNIPYIIDEDVSTILNAGDHAFAEPPRNGTLKKYGLTEANYFLCVSTLEPRKNFPSVIRAYLTYLNNTHSTNAKKLVIVGSQGWMDKVESSFLAEQEKCGNIVLTGRIVDSELTALISRARLFISGSFCEGFGLGALEALTLGTPALVPANTAQKEVVDGFGTVLDDWRPSNVANIMLQFDDDNHFQQARSTTHGVQSKFSWSVTADEYVTLYDDVLAK